MQIRVVDSSFRSAKIRFVTIARAGSLGPQWGKMNHGRVRVRVRRGAAATDGPGPDPDPGPDPGTGAGFCQSTVSILDNHVLDNHVWTSQIVAAAVVTHTSIGGRRRLLAVIKDYIPSKHGYPKHGYPR